MKLADTNSEFSRYSPYGVPTSFPRGDYDLDGDVDAADTTALGNFIAGGSYGWNLDFNGDGNVDSGDTDEHAAYVTGYDKGLGGRTVLSRSGVRNRAGYAGYEFEPALPNSAWHVRNRVLVSELGRWNRRDPLGYVDGVALLEFVRGGPMENVDPSGMRHQRCPSPMWSCGDEYSDFEQPPPSVPPAPAAPWWTIPEPTDPTVTLDKLCEMHDYETSPCRGNINNDLIRRNESPEALTYCCGGMKTYLRCVQIKADYPMPPFIPGPPGQSGPRDFPGHNLALSIIAQCVLQHEAVHAQEYSCSSEVGAPKPPPSGSNCSEYHGYTREIACLQAGKSHCAGSYTCERTIQKAIDGATNNRARYPCGSR